MKRPKVVVIGSGALLISLAVTLILGRQNQSPARAAGTLTPAMLAEDFAVFRAALEEAHPGIYRYTTKAEFDALFEEIEAGLSAPMSEQAFYQTLNPAVVALRCGHTKFHPERNFETPYNYGLTAQLPLALFVGPTGAWVEADLSPSPTIPVGAEVVAIDGKPMGDLIAQLADRVSFADGNGVGAKYLELSRYFSAYASTFIGSASTYEITYRAPDATEATTVSLPGISYETHLARLATQRNDAPPLALSFPDDRTALLTIRTFWFESKEINYERFLRESLAEITARGTEHLIIDLRDNEGGKDAYGALLYSYLTDQTFRYYDRITVTQRRPFSFREHAKLPWFFPLYRMLIRRDADGTFVWTRHSNLRIQDPQPTPYLGDVTVLINGRSFSVTSEFAAIARAHRRATFVGQETGGGYRGNNSGFFAIVTLPNSRLVVGIPLWGYYTAVDDPGASDGGVVPDIPVTRSFDDVLAGRDAELAAAMSTPSKRTE